MIKNLIFDVDGTIWNSTPIVARGWNRAIEETGYSRAVITPQILQREFGQPMDVIAEHLFGDVLAGALRQELLDRCCLYEQQLLEENEENIAYPDLHRTMEALAKSHGLYIVSNCQCGYIELVMKKNKLAALIRDFECFGNTGTSKGETIRILMERNGLKTEETVYIGDTMGDASASAAAGIAFVFAAYGFGQVPEAEWIIQSPGELTEIIKQMDAGR